MTNEEFEKLLKQRFDDNRVSKNIVFYNDRITNYTKISKYSLSDGSERFKLVFMPSCKKNGLERLKIDIKGVKKYKKQYVNDIKLDESISRAKKKIFDYALCNDWDYFFTGTLDQRKYDRTDLDRFHKDFTRWIRNLRRNGNNIQFLVIPELHNDRKSWHLHGFFSNIPVNYLRKFCIDEKLPYKIIDKIKNGEEIFDFPKYSKKFGFCDLEPIKDVVAVSCYCTKYITKELLSSVKEVGAHTYYHSRGLKLPQNELVGQVQKTKVLEFLNKISWDNENKYCRVKWIDQDIIELFKDYIEVEKGGV